MPAIQKESPHLALLRSMFPQQVTISVSDAARVIDWAPTSLINNLSRPRPLFRSLKIGDRRVVSIVDLAGFLDARAEAATQPTKPTGRPRRGAGGAV